MMVASARQALLLIHQKAAVRLASELSGGVTDNNLELVVRSANGVVLVVCTIALNSVIEMVDCASGTPKFINSVFKELDSALEFA